MGTDLTPPPVVVGIDDSPGSERALIWATREAGLRDAPLLLVHGAGNDIVCSDSQRAGEDVGNSIVLALEKAERLLDEAAASVHALDPTVDVMKQVSLDSSGPALLQGADDPVLVVVGARSGTREHSTLDTLERNLGQGLECPIVEVGDSGGSRQVVVLAEGTTSVPLLTHTFEEAAIRDLEVLVIFVLADPLPGSPAQDLCLMDEVARIEAASGPSSLGLQRTLLAAHVHRIHRQFPRVRFRIVDLDAEIDEELATTAGTAAYVAVDAAHLRRFHEMAQQCGGRQWVSVLVPSHRPSAGWGAAQPSPVAELRAEPGEAPRSSVEQCADLEAWWEGPTVDEPPIPVRARAHRQHRRRGGQQLPPD